MLKSVEFDIRRYSNQTYVLVMGLLHWVGGNELICQNAFNCCACIVRDCYRSEMNLTVRVLNKRSTKSHYHLNDRKCTEHRDDFSVL